MPSRMVINTESTVGYKNKLKQNLGVSKVKLPHVQYVVSHVRKAAENVESLAAGKETSALKSTTTKHELDLILIMIAATAKAWLLFR